MKLNSDGTEKAQLERKIQFIENTGKRRKIKKRYRDRTKQYRQNRIFQKNERKLYEQVGAEWATKY